ncbi:hypothetical protein RhiJN_20238 [Ceratobasidium sp. AG-Ba]|nr:hypothetical protein RhiJN_20238 [Ceratobasidium sp. AG-Ba]
MKNQNRDDGVITPRSRPRNVVHQIETAVKNLEQTAESKLSITLPIQQHSDQIKCKPTLTQQELGTGPRSPELPPLSASSLPSLSVPSSPRPTLSDIDRPRSPPPSSPPSPMDRATNLLHQNRELEQYLLEHIQNLQSHGTSSPPASLRLVSRSSTLKCLGHYICPSASTPHSGQLRAGTPEPSEPSNALEASEETWEEIDSAWEAIKLAEPEEKTEGPSKTPKEKTKKYQVLLETLEED